MKEAPIVPERIAATDLELKRVRLGQHHVGLKVTQRLAQPVKGLLGASAYARSVEMLFAS